MKNWQKELNVFTYGYLPNGLHNTPYNIKNFFRNIGRAWQRVTRGYCDCDTWNLDGYLTVLIANAVEYLKENTHGHPAELTEEDWNKILTDIHDHLLNSLEDNEDTPCSKLVDEHWRKMDSYVKSVDFVREENKPYSTMVTTYTDEDEYNKCKDLWLKAEQDAWAWRESEKDAGLDLLKKWWFSLWD